MKNEELGVLLQGINAVGSLKGLKFAYAIAKNKKAVTSEVEILQESIKPSEGFAKYDKERMELCKELADKDDKGNPKMANNEFVIVANKEDFDIRVKALRERNKDVIDERDKQLKEFNELLKAESDFKPFKIDFEDVPQDITADAMSKIAELINEPKK